MTTAQFNPRSLALVCLGIVIPCLTGDLFKSGWHDRAIRRYAFLTASGVASFVIPSTSYND